MFDLDKFIGIMKPEEIRIWLSKLNKTETWLAESIGESKQRINYLVNEKGKNPPKKELIDKIDNFLLRYIEENGGNTNYDKFNIFSYKSNTIFPIVSNVRAGVPNMVLNEDIIGYAAFDYYGSQENCIGVKITGDSMNPDYKEGDMVLIDKNAFIDVGNVVVAVFKDGSHTIKKYKIRNSEEVELVPLNTAYFPQIVHKKEIEAIYKVVSLTRKVN